MVNCFLLYNHKGTEDTEERKKTESQKEKVNRENP